MKISSTVAMTALAALTLPQCAKAKLHGGKRSLEAPQAIECTIVEIDSLNPNGEEDSVYRCVLDEEGLPVDYDIVGLQSDFFENHPVHSGLTGLSASHAFKTKANENGANTIRIIPGAVISTYMKNKNSGRNLRSDNKNDHQRKLWMLEGDPTLLVVRVKDSAGTGPRQSTSTLSDDVFGTANDPANMKSQFEGCSKGKLRFQKGTGSGITDGVMEIQVSHNLNGVGRYTAMDYAVAETQSVLGSSKYNSFDHIMYVMPQYVDFGGAAAFAYIGWYRSVFMDQYASHLQVQVHEFGHNLRMRHSGEGSATYGDGTGMMGAHVWSDDRPHQCFNAAKSWYTGWYSDAHVAIDPIASSWSGEFVGVDDYVNHNYDPDNHKVVAKIGSNLYMMYNRQKGINREVPEYGNQVTVVEQASEGNSQSWLLAHLVEGGEHRFAQWNGQTHDLFIKVCDQSPITADTTTTDTAAVLVVLDDGVNSLDCPSATASPTTSPPTTPSPTTLAPTTPAPTTALPTTPAPTTLAPTTPAPTTAPPTTPAPTTLAPITPVPTTAPPTTPAPTTLAPTTPAPTTTRPTTPAPTTPAPTTPAPTTATPTTLAPTLPPICQVEVNVPGTCMESADCCVGMSCTKGKSSERSCYWNGGGGGGGGGGGDDTCSMSSCRDLPCCDGLTCNSKNKECR